MNPRTNQVNDIELNVIIRELNRVINSGALGDVVELGCYDGGTSIHMAKRINGTDKLLYVYDSFEGLPEKTTSDVSPIGTQFKLGELNVSKKQFIINIKKAGVPMPIIKKGWFNDVCTNDLPEKICFAFLDGDYYQSIVDSFCKIENILSPGATIIVDDYSSPMLPGVSKAVDEWLQKHKARLQIEQSLAIIYL